jgi:sugar O-acyltransferase (sialic acid O-acetyltransferase NeuD family)
MTSLLILGTGGHSLVVIESALDSGKHILGLLDTDYKNQQEEILGVRVLGGIDVLDDYAPTEVSIIVAIGDNEKRNMWFLKLKEMGFKLDSIVNPSAILSNSCDIGEGVFINSGAIINAKSVIGDNSIINTGVIVEHEVKIGKNCHLAPGVRVGGRTTIGQNSFIGIGASIANHITIEREAVVGAGSVIVKDVGRGITVVGIGRVLS